MSSDVAPHDEARSHAARVLLEKQSLKVLDEIYASRSSIVWKARHVDEQGSVTVADPIAVKVYIKSQMRDSELKKVCVGPLKCFPGGGQALPRTLPKSALR